MVLVILHVDEMIVATPEANSPVNEDHPLNPNPASNWQNFFKVMQFNSDLYGTSSVCTYGTVHPVHLQVQNW